MHLPFCAHLINIFSFSTGVELRHFFPSEMRRGCLVCVICNSNSFHNDFSHIEDVHLLFFTHFMIFFSFLGSLTKILFSDKCLEGVWFV